MGTFFGWVLIVILLALTFSSTFMAFFMTLTVWAVEFVLNIYFLPFTLFQSFFVIWGIFVLLSTIGSVITNAKLTLKNK